MAEEKSVEELEQETRNKLEIYETLLKENPTLNEIYHKSNKAAWGALVGILLFIGFGIIGLFPVGLAAFIGTWVFFYKRNNRFDLAFEETASDELKKARKDYEDCKKRQEEAEKAKKEKRSAERQAKIQQVKEQAAQAVIQRADTRSTAEEVDDEDREATEEELEETFRKILIGVYHREVEIVSPHLIYTGNLSDRIDKNALIAYSYIGKAMLLMGEIIKIDYDREKNMPYVLIGSGHYLSSGVCDRYACYFSDPGQIDTVKKLQVGDNLILFGIFSEHKFSIPSHYFLSQSYIWEIRE